MAALFPQIEREPEQQPTERSPATLPPGDLLLRARQAAEQEMEDLRKPLQRPQRPRKSTLLTGHTRRFE